MPVLGIDVGTSGSRALLLGGGRASARVDNRGPRAVPVAADGAGRSRIPTTGGAPAQQAVRSVLATTRHRRRARSRAIGLSGQMHGAVLLDAAGAVLRPAIIWCDQRTEQECRWLDRDGRRRRGCSSSPSNPALTNFTLTKLLWVRTHEPDALAPRPPRAAAEGLRPLSAERRARDRRRRRVRHADARRRAPAVVAGDAGRGRHRCRPPARGVRVAGRFARACRARPPRATGLRAGTPIVAGAGDQAAGAVGMGITRPGAVSATIGTSGVVFAATDRPALDPGGRLHTFCHAIPGSLARDGRHAGGGPVAALAPRSVRPDGGGRSRGTNEMVTEASRRPAGRRRRALGALPDGRAHSAPRPERPRRARRTRRQPHARRTSSARCSRGGVQPARYVHDLCRARPPGRASPAGRRRRAVGARGARSRPTSTARLSRPSPTEEGAGYGAALLAGRRRRLLALGRRGVRCRRPNSPGHTCASRSGPGHEQSYLAIPSHISRTGIHLQSGLTNAHAVPALRMPGNPSYDPSMSKFPTPRWVTQSVVGVSLVLTLAAILSAASAPVVHLRPARRRNEGRLVPVPGSAARLRRGVSTSTSAPYNGGCNKLAACITRRGRERAARALQISRVTDMSAASMRTSARMATAPAACRSASRRRCRRSSRPRATSPSRQPAPRARPRTSPPPPRTRLTARCRLVLAGLRFEVPGGKDHGELLGDEQPRQAEDHVICCDGEQMTEWGSG